MTSETLELLNADERKRNELNAAFLKKIEHGEIPLDSVTSLQTLALVDQHGATGVDMTTLWALTAQNWVCPSCQRSKKDIVRVNKHGELSCWLVAHHDHMKELLVKTFTKKSTTRGKVVADEAAKRFAKRSASMVCAFDETVVCIDCNNVDATAKKIAKTHPDFSYSPADIHAFVIAIPNQIHKINEDVAKQIWLERKDLFDLRLRIIERIAEIAADNQHWHQSIALNHQADYIYHAANNLVRQYTTSFDLNGLTGFKKSKSNKFHSSWRTAPKFFPKKVPSEGEIEHLQKVTHTHIWSNLPESWSCPVCFRSKVQTIRLNNKDEWIFLALSRSYWTGKRNRYNNLVYEADTLCQDCQNTAHAIGKEAIQMTLSDTKSYSRIVNPIELQPIVIAKPHARHVINNLEAEELIKRIVCRIVKNKL